MKRMFVTVLSLVVLIPSLAGAVPWTWTDVFDPTPNIYFGSGLNSYVYVHDIRDVGFDVGEDFVSSADLTIDLNSLDSLNSSASNSSAFIRIAGLPLFTGTPYQFQYDDNVLGVNILGLIELNLLGELTVSILRTGGAFFLDKSTLVAHGNETRPTPVAEPSTIFLLGAGLIGLARFSKKIMRVNPHRTI